MNDILTAMNLGLLVLLAISHYGKWQTQIKCNRHQIEINDTLQTASENLMRRVRYLETRPIRR